MTSQIIPVDPFDFIIFGGTGDLSERKLLPALYHRQRDHQFSEPTRIIGASRSKLSDDGVPRLRQEGDPRACEAPSISTRPSWTKFLSRLSYVAADAKTGDGFAKLKKAIGNSDVDPGVLSGGRACAVRRHLRQAQGAHAGHAEFAHRRRKADRPRPRFGAARSTT